MKKLLPLLAISLLFSCGESSETVSKSPAAIDFSYTIDTVRIDAKGEFLFLNMNLFMSDYDPKTDLLYNLNPESSRMEMIDMNKLALHKLIQYDQDGPNAVKEMFTSGIKITESGEKWFTDYYSIIQMDTASRKTATLRLDNENFPGDTLSPEFKINGMGKISRSGMYFVNHYGDFVVGGAGMQGLAILNLEDRTKQLLKLDIFQELDKYILTAPDGERAGARAGEQNYILLTDTKILHSNSAQNKLLSVNLPSAEPKEIVLKSELVLDEKPGSYPKKASSMEQFEEYNVLKKQELTFGPWIHDSERDYFWRISRQKKEETVKQPIFSFVITVLDSNLNQISETEVAQGEVLFSNSFFRKGELYMFLNIEDEMAFLRLKPNFKNQ
jgi:uncharacterized protein YuzE